MFAASMSTSQSPGVRRLWRARANPYPTSNLARASLQHPKVVPERHRGIGASRHRAENWQSMAGAVCLGRWGRFWQIFSPPLARGVRRGTCWSYDLVEGLICRRSSTSFQAFSDKGAIHEQSPEP